MVENPDWENASDRDSKILGRHSRAYYKAADRWLRGEVDAFRLSDTDPAQAARRLEEASAARADLDALHFEREA